MTEGEWLACTDPQPMLTFLGDSGTASEGKLRLFACACCRLVWPLLRHESQLAVQSAERCAAGLVTSNELATAYAAAEGACRSLPHRTWADHAAEEAGEAVRYTASSGAAWPWSGHRAVAGAGHLVPGPSSPGILPPEYDPLYAAHMAGTSVARAAAYAGKAGRDFLAAKQRECDLLRDIFGNPFRPVTVSPAWQTPQVAALAQAAYDERELPAGTLDLARLAVLADALEEAGCDQADLLGHLRGPGPHVRGCWAVDLVLGKE
jgi:hypothetical protein